MEAANCVEMLFEPLHGAVAGGKGGKRLRIHDMISIETGKISSCTHDRAILFQSVDLYWPWYVSCRN